MIYLLQYDSIMGIRGWIGEPLEMLKSFNSVDTGINQPAKGGRWAELMKLMACNVSNLTGGGLMGYTGPTCLLAIFFVRNRKGPWAVAKAMVDWTLVDFRPTGDFAAASFTWPDGLLNQASTQKSESNFSKLRWAFFLFFRNPGASKQKFTHS